MSRQPNDRDGGPRRGPYGPNNPPPPPVTTPPRAPESQRMEGRGRPERAVRKRHYAKAEADHLYAREQERMRSRSPVREQERMRGRSPAYPQYRLEKWARYRERSPMRREPMSTSPRRDERGFEVIRCFACNELGHRAADCSSASHFGKKSCFRCGEAGHIARTCRVRIGQVKIETEVAADKSDSGFNGRYNNDRGNDMGWHPSQEATADSHVVGNSSDAQERSSLLPSCVGYYVEDEVDWGMENHDPPMAKSKKPDQHYVHPQRESMVREPYLGLAHFKNANIDEIPPTVQDLRAYDYRIKVMFESKAKNQRFANGGNGKVAPALYGSEQRHDLGLCFATFLTRKRCEMGVNCPWRHHPLSNAEKAWIIEYGKKKGKEFIDNVDRWWSHPEVPVPGATMQGLGEKDT